MKLCPSCKLEKSVDKFSKNRSTADGFDCYCRQCRVIIRKKFRNPELEKISQIRNRTKLVTLNRSLKNNPCMDCKQIFHFSAMEWDHRPGTNRIDDVGKLANRSATRLFLAEVEKCDLVCANCHALRTWNRRESAKNQSVSP